MKDIPTSIITLIVGVALTLISLWVGQNNGLLPVAASEGAPYVDSLFNAMMTLATGLFLLVQGVIVVALWKFRRPEGDRMDGPPIHGNIPLEIVWTAIPAIMVLGISLYSFEVYNSMGGLDPHASHDRPSQEVAHMSGAAMAATLQDAESGASTAPKERARVAVGLGASPETLGDEPSLNVEVAGMQYAWVFTYPDSGVVAGELHLPVGQDVRLNIVAYDVIHALWIPQFRIKQDAVPGRTTELRFVPKIEGTYPVICAELCGAYHGIMQTLVVVESQEAFDEWQQEMLASGNTEMTVASRPTEMSESDFLAPYVRDMGVDANTLQQLHHHHQ